MFPENLTAFAATISTLTNVKMKSYSRDNYELIRMFSVKPNVAINLCLMLFDNQNNDLEKRVKINELIAESVENSVNVSTCFLKDVKNTPYVVCWLTPNYKNDSLSITVLTANKHSDLQRLREFIKHEVGLTSEFSV